MRTENPNTFERLLGSQFNLFLGAGFSVAARDIDGKYLPVGDALRDELCDKFKIQNSTSLELSQISTILEKTRLAEFRQFLNRRYQVEDFDNRYKVLDKYDVDTIFTTNIDDLLFKLYSESKEKFGNDVYQNGPAHSDRSAVNIVTLHGCIRHSNRALVMGALDIASAFTSDPTNFRHLAFQLKQRPTIFWGYRLRDAGTLTSLLQSAESQHDKWIVLRHEESNELNKEYLRALGFQIVEADTLELLDFLVSMQGKTMKPTPVAPSVSTRALFGDLAIPDVNTIPVRPIIDYYRGDAPQWSDIYQGQLTKTTHFNTARDMINSGNDVILLGIAASGKTTLMMQLAAFHEFAGHKLILDYCPIEKAVMIEKAAAGAQALVFLDNLADSVDAFEHLRRTPNIQVVAAERDYYYDIISHLINKTHLSKQDITDLSLQDAQSIVNKIPTAVRFVPEDQANENVQSSSLFDLIQKNVTYPNLRTRFASVLRDIEEEDWKLADLLLLICYMNRCRVPCAIDTILSYFGTSVRDYDEVYKLIETLGAMVGDYYGELSDDTQDFFRPRSRLIAEALIQQAPSALLKRMLRRFNQNVRQWQIPHYNVFRVMAYDHELMERAFQDWEGGRQFYEDVFKATESPYVLQQGALYLSNKGEHSLAFGWIDRAISKTKYEIWTIRNSHAAILFKANIDKNPQDPTVRDSLRQSMEILAKCYNSDRRKLFHAQTFASQAIGFHDVVGGTESMEYLRQARAWLVEESRTDRITRRSRNLLDQINANLSRQ